MARKALNYDRTKFASETLFAGGSVERATSFLGTYITQADWKTSADGIEFMDPTVKTLKAALEEIRNTALNALRQIDDSQEQLSMRWTCKDCRHTKHFMTPVPLEAAGRCPWCKGTEFRPVL